MLNVGDKVTISATWLEACGLTAYVGRTWTIESVRQMPNGDYMYGVRNARYGAWQVWSIRRLTKVLTTQERKARKAARKHMRIYAQQPYVAAVENHKAAMRALASVAAMRASLLIYRNCWQYGRYVHGAVSGIKADHIARLRDELDYARACRETADRNV